MPSGTKPGSACAATSTSRSCVWERLTFAHPRRTQGAAQLTAASTLRRAVLLMSKDETGGVLGAAADARLVLAMATDFADAAGRLLPLLADSGGSSWRCAAYLQRSAAVLESHILLLQELQALTSSLRPGAETQALPLPLQHCSTCHTPLADQALHHQGTHTVISLISARPRHARYD